MTDKQSPRQERGRIQRERLRRLVAGDVPSSSPGTPDGPEAMARLAGGAAWWSRQNRWGDTVTAPARQIGSTVLEARTAPPRSALLFELGRLALSFSQTLVREVGKGRTVTFDRPGGATAVQGYACPVCHDEAQAHTWTEDALEFLQVTCARCRSTATTSRTALDPRPAWVGPRFVDAGSALSLGVPAVAVCAASLDGDLVSDDTWGRSPLTVVLPRPRRPGGTETGSRLLLLADLAPTEVIWNH